MSMLNFLHQPRWQDLGSHQKETLQGSSARTFQSKLKILKPWWPLRLIHPAPIDAPRGSKTPPRSILGSDRKKIGSPRKWKLKKIGCESQASASAFRFTRAIITNPGNSSAAPNRRGHH